MKRIVLLGATGSVGQSALQVIEASDHLQLVGCSAASDYTGLIHIAQTFGCEQLALGQKKAALPATLRWHLGENAATELIAETQPDLVVCAIAGAAALAPVLKAFELGIDVALASKEILVMAGDLVMQKAHDAGVHIFPLDSEHAALWQCLQNTAPDLVAEVILTGSGGPFYKAPADLTKVTVAEALAHPRWSMGPKITVDSATLMNKVFEQIEAAVLFGFTPQQISVIMHPQAVVHAAVVLKDGTMLAQMNPPDMCYALNHMLHQNHSDQAVRLQPLDLTTLSRLDFAKPDEMRFPALSLGRQVMQLGGSALTTLNAANDVAVNAFLEGKLPYHGLVPMLETLIHQHTLQSVATLEEVLSIDRQAREAAEVYLYEHGFYSEC